MDHPRFVDPRIAKGRARSISDATSQFTFLRVFDGAIKRVSKQWRPGMSGRKAFRYMERVLKPELDKHLVTFPLIRLGEMTLYCGLFEQRRHWRAGFLLPCLFVSGSAGRRSHVPDRG